LAQVFIFDVLFIFVLIVSLHPPCLLANSIFISFCPFCLFVFKSWQISEKRENEKNQETSCYKAI